MPGRRGARAGRGWDAIPPRPADDDPPGGGLRPGDPERGNVSGRRRRTSPGDRNSEDGGGGSGWSGSAAFGSSGSTFGGSGSSGGADRRRRGSAGRGSFGGGSGAFGSSGSNTGAGRGRGRRPTASDRIGDHPVGGSAIPEPPGSGSGARRGDARPDEPPRTESEIAREICLRQLAVRPRTRAELAKALARREISDEVIAEVLDRYDEVGIIDDAAFARAWVSSRHHGRGLAKRALANELRQRGVDAETAGEALESLDEDAEAVAARALVDRKLRTATGTPEQVFRRLVGMLARKGYPAGIAIRAVKDALAARDAEAAEFADHIDADALADESTDTTS
jgi:regulatory protein